MDIKLKNTTGSDIELDDLGQVILASSELDVTDSYSPYELSVSTDLATAMASGDILMNDGENPGNFDLASHYGSFSFSISGNLKDEDEIDGFRVMTAKGEIVRVIVSLNERGQTNDSPTIFDIHKATPGVDLSTQINDTAFSTIYTTSTNRPELTGDNANKSDNCIVEAALPDDASFDFGDMFKLEIVQHAKKSEDANVTIIYKLT